MARKINLYKYAFAAVAALMVAAVSFFVPAMAGETGTLKLKVKECGGSWLSGAEVHVSVWRDGEGEVDSANGTTSLNGYIQFTFTDLEDGDRARVTVSTAAGEDDDHEYEWESSGDEGDYYWDLVGPPELPCDDEWYDEDENIILLYYNG